MNCGSDILETQTFALLFLFYSVDARPCPEDGVENEDEISLNRITPAAEYAQPSHPARSAVRR